MGEQLIGTVWGDFGVKTTYTHSHTHVHVYIHTQDAAAEAAAARTELFARKAQPPPKNNTEKAGRFFNRYVCWPCVCMCVWLCVQVCVNVWVRLCICVCAGMYARTHTSWVRHALRGRIVCYNSSTFLSAAETTPPGPTQAVYIMLKQYRKY